MVGGAVLGLLGGPVSAHNQNGNPSAPTDTDPGGGRHDVTAIRVVNVDRTKPDPCSFNTAPYGPACATPRTRVSPAAGTTSTSSMMISIACCFFLPTDVGRTITGSNIVAGTIITAYTNSYVTISSFPTTTTSTASFTVVLDPIIVRAPTFDGTHSTTQHVSILLCNDQIIDSTGNGGAGDLLNGCDYANAVGLAPLASGFPASSGTLTLDASGNLTSPATVQLNPSSCNGASGSLTPDLLTALSGPTCTNNAEPTATCPPTQSQIAAGRTCRILVAEYDPTVTFALGTHVGYRVTNMKSPIPTKLCDPPGGPVSFGACGATIAPGTSVKLTGLRFPCKVIHPDDPIVSGNQGSCLAAWADKTILIKRSATGSLEGGKITPTSQTASVNGDYVVTFTFPTLLHPGELYKVVPHAPTCPPPFFNQGNAGYNDGGLNTWIVNSCESGSFNAAGSSVKQ
jgi:hypothetical protein